MRIPRQDFSTNPDQFGAGNGRLLVSSSKALQKALAELREIDGKKQEEEDAFQREVEAGMTPAELNERDATPLLHVFDTSGERLNNFVDELKGGATAATGEAVEAGMRKIGLEEATGLSNPRQFDQYDDFFMRRLVTKKAEIERHGADQAAAENRARLESIKARELASAMANYHDVRVVRAAKFAGIAAIELAMAGQDPAAIVTAKNDYVSTIVVAVAGKFLDDDPELGQTYIAKTAKQIMPQARPRVVQMHAAAFANRAARTEALAIWDQAGGDAAEALAAADGIGGETEPAVKALVEQRATAALAAEKEDQNAANDRAWITYKKNGDLNSIAVFDWVAMSEAQRATLTAQAEFGATGSPPESDPTVFLRLSGMSAATLQVEDLRLYQHQLSAGDYTNLLAMKKNPDAPATRTARAIHRATFEALGARGKV